MSRVRRASATGSAGGSLAAPAIGSLFALLVGLEGRGRRPIGFMLVLLALAIVVVIGLIGAAGEVALAARVIWAH